MTFARLSRAGGRLARRLAPVGRVTALVAACGLVSVQLARAEETAAQAALRRPGDRTLLTLHAVGTQNYVCTANGAGALAWVFKAPAALLFDGGTRAGRHFAGPTWELNDGSGVTASVQAKAAGDGDAIPWLRLDVTGHTGSGALAAATSVLRINTIGGLSPPTCGEAGSVLQVAYQADYVFLQRP